MPSQKRWSADIRSAAEPLRSKIGDDELRAALQEANLPTLLAALAQLTGDDTWLTGTYRPTSPLGVDDHDSAGLSPELQAQAREDAFRVLRAWHDGEFEAAPPPSPERLTEMLHLSLGSSQKLPEDFGGLLAEELGVLDRDPVPAPDMTIRHIEVLVIGAGLSGLCAAVKLKKAGVAFTILDKNPAVGGTWLENVYPACGVDTPSHLYCYSFAQSPNWTRYFAKRDELYAYLEEVADHFDLRRHIRFDSEVETMNWDEDAQHWRVTVRSSTGERDMLTADAVISGVGLLNRPAIPAIPGLETFAGPSMHTANWDTSVEVTGKRVVVIGTGASAMQLVPAIAGQAAHVTVFQRSPQWGLPNPNYMRETSEATRTLMAHVPFYLGWYRLRLVWNFGDRLYPALQIDPDWPHPERSVNRSNDKHREYLTEYIRSELGDRQDLLEKCLPTYPPYGKRPLLDNGWFRTMTRDDVTLCTDPVVEVREHSVVDANGVEHPADILVLATGFQAVRVLGPMEVRGRSGKSLREVWGEDDARAYLGTTVPDFPNFFLLLGPNTFGAHGGSAALTMEMQVRHVLSLLLTLASGEATSIEVRQEVFEAYDRRISDALTRTIWSHPGMTTYYRNAAGRIVIPMPWTNVEFWQMTHDVNLDDFHLTPAPDPAPAQAG
ncbi:flavin-containing monooxygenase [Sporichthya polymorpha]|uniref:flavin-containing monooxygenase n=1 Tax=Sporichthya polymorpha TaxID=35751 RepID=UPI000379F553|nr:NAD(P)/FAD-dependent oxidoreductase [Sporichthya polymorpha]